jgi:hypothetical protein
MSTGAEAKRSPGEPGGAKPHAPEQENAMQESWNELQGMPQDSRPLFSTAQAIIQITPIFIPHLITETIRYNR